MISPGTWRHDGKPTPNELGFHVQDVWAHHNGSLVHVCDVVGTPDDAHLISAAPDLLEALEALLMEVTDNVDWHMPFSDPNHGWHEVWKQAHEAINKAKGIK